MTDPTLTRRTLLAAGAGGALACSAFPLTSVAARASRNPIARGGTFASGVAAGVPSAQGALIWTRLDGIGPRARVAYEVARDPEFRQTVGRGFANASALRDSTARVAIGGLPAGEHFFYRFSTPTSASPVGRFRTLRPADSREPVRIGFFSCQRYEHGFFTAHGPMADEDLDLVVSLGDYIYEEDATPKLPERATPEGGEDNNVQTLDQFRARWRRYRNDPNLLRMHAAHAVVPIWDDCEVEGNWAGEGPSSGPTPVDRRSIPFADKRRNGFYAYFENMPVERVRGGDRFKVFRSIALGANAELLLLDTRQFRDPQPCEDRDFSSGIPCLDDAAPGRRRLGDGQKAWLKERLQSSQATWKVLGNAQMMMALDIAPSQPVAHDGWDGYAAERREILEFVREKGIANVTSIVGDVHVFFAGELHTTGRIDGPAVGTEFVGASVSHDALNLPALTTEQSALLTERLPLANPHLRYTDFKHRGYAVLELRPDELRAEFKAVRTVLEPTSEAFTLQRFRVAAGTPRVELS